MPQPLSAFTDSRDNNFNLLRLIAAILVLVSHSFALATGSGNAEPLRQLIGFSWGNIAVDVFFITSGFLITRSWLTRKTAAAFFWARFIRIWPALIVAVMFCAFVVGPAFTTLPAGDYLTSRGLLKFIVYNTLLINGIAYSLPGVFADTPYQTTVNGSLWTLPYEVMMYALIAFILSGLSYLHQRIPLRFSLKVGMGLLSTVTLAADVMYYHQHLSLHPGLHLAFMFFSGSAYYLWRDRVHLSAALFAVILIIVLLSARSSALFMVSYNLGIPYLVLFLAYVPGGALRSFNRLGDYSYGTYIYAFPVQQSIVALNPGCSVLFLGLTSLAATLILALGSWHMIEKFCLRLKDPGLVFRSLRLKTRIATE